MKYCYLIFFTLFTLLGFGQDQKFLDSIQNQNKWLLAEFNEEYKEPIYYYFLDDVDENHIVSDTSLNDFHIYDPIRLATPEWVNTGNGGSVSYPLSYIYDHTTRFDHGFHSYKLYNHTLDNYKFYRAEKSYSDLFFSPLAGQENFIARAKYAQPFKDNINLSVDYQRLLYNGFYQNQMTKTTNFGASLSYDSQEGKFGFILTHLSNVNEEEFNGGITSEGLSGTLVDNRDNVDVNLSEAMGRNQEKILDLKSYYDLTSDSSVWDFKVLFNLSNNTGYFKFYDENVSIDNSGDNLIYGDYIDDIRGIRRYWNVDHFSISPGVELKKSDEFLLKGLIEYRNNQFSLEGMSGSQKDVTLKSSIKFKLKEAIKIKGKLELGLADNAGNFFLEGNLFAKWSTNLSANGYLSFFRRSPSLIQTTGIFNYQSYYNNDFDNTFGNILGFQLKLKKLKTLLGVEQSSIKNPIYWNTEREATQFDDIFLATKVFLTQSLSLYKFGLDIHATYQTFNNNIFNLPDFFGKINFYYGNLLFNNILDLRVGIETRLIDTHQTNSYMPLLGQFHNTERELESYPLTDFYITAQVSEFRFFIRIEHINSYFNSNDVYFILPDYPYIDGSIRLGVRWTLYD